MSETTDPRGSDTRRPDEGPPGLPALPGGGDEAQRRMGARLKECREYLGLSQQLVSERTGIPRTAMSDIERGQRKVDSFELGKLAFIYRKPLEYFLDEDPDADPDEHAVRFLAHAAAGMSEDDRRKLVDYAKLLEVAARVERRPRR